MLHAVIIGETGLTRACRRRATRAANRGTWLGCRYLWVGVPRL